jgi:peptidoglycan/LPS O-acetylase OafA/YrhL
VSAPLPKTAEPLPCLDYLRGIAILIVFAFHAVGATFDGFDTLPFQGWFRDFHVAGSFLAVVPFTLGWSGVDLFLVISGFCIHLSHQRSRDRSWKVFFLRRFFRIYPPYFLALVIFALLRLPFASSFWPSVVVLLKHVFLVNNFMWSYGGINGPFWSIALEVQLYLLYPLLLLVASRLGWQVALWLTGTVFFGTLVAQAILESLYPGISIPPGVGRSPLHYWFTWAVGAALADAYLKGEPLPFLRVPFYLWLGLALISYFFAPSLFLITPLLGMAVVHLIAFCLSRRELTFPPRLGFFFGQLRTIGLISYSAYLLHGPVTKFSHVALMRVWHGHPLPLLLVFAFCLATWLIVYPISYVYHYAIELPSITLGKWVIQKSRGIGSLPPGSLPSERATVSL